MEIEYKNKIRKSRKVSINSYKKGVNWFWCFKIFLLSFCLSCSFSLLSNVLLNKIIIAVSIFVILFFVILGVLFDMVGVAVTSGEIDRYTLEYADKKFLKEALVLMLQADKVSVFCCDIVGDICGILSGACGSSILASIVINSSNNSILFVSSAILSGLIAGFTIFCKSVEKSFAVNKSHKIIHFTACVLGKCISIANSLFKKRVHINNKNKLTK